MVRFLIATTFSCGAAAVCACCHGQTTSGPAPIPFCQPTLQLRHDSTPAAVALQAQPVTPKPGELVHIAPEPSLVASVNQPTVHLSFVRHDQIYLVRDEARFDRDMDRLVDNVYRPEIFHVGKVPMSSPVWTAIKRKNPLCLLLNPILFQASW
jgi:hypothetical protein